MSLPIYLTATNDMGHFILQHRSNGHMDMNFDTMIYDVVMKDIETSYLGTCGFVIVKYHVKHPNHVKEYQLNGKTYIVDFSQFPHN
jgi:hypothetical protein